MGAARRGAGQERTAGDSGSRWPRQWICESGGDQTPIIFRALTHPSTPPALTAVTTSWSASGRAHQPILSQLSSPLFFADRIASRSRPKHESTPVDTTPPGQSSDGTPWLTTSEVLTLTVIVSASRILHLSTGIFWCGGWLLRGDNYTELPKIRANTRCSRCQAQFLAAPCSAAPCSNDEFRTWFEPQRIPDRACRPSTPTKQWSPGPTSRRPPQELNLNQEARMALRASRVRPCRHRVRTTPTDLCWSRQRCSPSGWPTSRPP